MNNSAPRIIDSPPRATPPAMEPASPKVSLIVTTYERPDALDAVLGSLSRQTRTPDEIIVADDGSGADTRACVERWKQRGLPLTHVWQPDEGFRASVVRNLAVAHAQCDYLIFLDGDCMVFPDFVETHLKLAESGWLVVGSRILMSQTLTEGTLNGVREPLTWPRRHWLAARLSGQVNRLSPLIRISERNPLRKLRRCRWQGAHSCNLGIWFTDFSVVNGFDEDYEGWGHEDADLVTRLFKSGVKRKDGHYAVPILHLWHPIQSRHAENENRQRLADILSGQRQISTSNGLLQHVDNEIHVRRLRRCPRLSAVIITRDAARHLDACLRSVSFADEIIVVDSGSTDATRKIAERWGARFICHEWEGFGRQKQFAVEQARNPWILALDADEWVSDELATAIHRTLYHPGHQAYAFPRRNRFMGHWLRHGEGYPDINLRLFHRDHTRWSSDPVHEKLLTNVEVGRLPGDLMHESEDGLTRYLEKQNRYTTLQANMLLETGKSPSTTKLLFNPLVRFIKFYIFRLGFLDGLPGLVHISVGCYNTFMKYAKLREMSQRR